MLTHTQSYTFMKVGGNDSMCKSLSSGPRSACKRKLDILSDTNTPPDNFEHKMIRYQRKKANESDHERELRLENYRKVVSCRKQKCQVGLKCNKI